MLHDKAEGTEQGNLLGPVGNLVHVGQPGIVAHATFRSIRNLLHHSHHHQRPEHHHHRHEHHHQRHEHHHRRQEHHHRHQVHQDIVKRKCVS